MALASPLVGAFTERVGARAVFSLAIVLVGTTLVLSSHMQNLWQFYALVSSWAGRRRVSATSRPEL